MQSLTDEQFLLGDDTLFPIVDSLIKLHSIQKVIYFIAEEQKSKKIFRIKYFGNYLGKTTLSSKEEVFLDMVNTYRYIMLHNVT